MPYVKGKYFYFRQQLRQGARRAQGDRARPHLLLPRAVLRRRGQRRAWAASTRRRDRGLRHASSRAEAKTDSQKRITELAHLALGAHLSTTAGSSPTRIDEYAQDRASRATCSTTRSTRAAWVSIKGKDYAKARALARPAAAQRARLAAGARGQAAHRATCTSAQNAYGPATDAFTKTRDEYEPIHKQLDDALAKQPAIAPALLPRSDRQEPRQVRHRGDPAADRRSKWVQARAGRASASSTLIGDESDLQQVARRVGRDRRAPREGDDRAGARQRLPRAGDGARQGDRDRRTQLTEVKQAAGRRETRADRRRSAGAEQRSSTQLEQRARRARAASCATLPASADVDRASGSDEGARRSFNELDKRVRRAARPSVNGVRAPSASRSRKFYQDAVQKRRCRPSSSAARAARSSTSVVRRARGRAADARTTSCARIIDDAAQSVGVDDADMQQAQQLQGAATTTCCKPAARARRARCARASAPAIAPRPSRSSRSSSARAASSSKVDRVQRSASTSMLDARLKDMHVAARRREGARRRLPRSTLGGYTSESADVGGGIMAESFKTVTHALLQHRGARRRRHHRRGVGAQGLDDARDQPAGAPSASASSSCSTTSSKKCSRISHEDASSADRLRCWWRCCWRRRWRARADGPRLPGPDRRAKELDAMQQRDRALRRGDQGLPRHRHAHRAAGVRREAQAS